MHGHLNVKYIVCVATFSMLHSEALSEQRTVL